MTCPERHARRIGRRTLSCPQTGRRHSKAAPPRDIARYLPSASLKARPRLSVRRDRTLSPPGRAVHHRGQDVRPPSTPRASRNAVSRGTRMPTLERPSRQRRPQRATRRVHADTPAIQLTTPQGSSCSSSHDQLVRQVADTLSRSPSRTSEGRRSPCRTRRTSAHAPSISAPCPRITRTSGEFSAGRSSLGRGLIPVDRRAASAPVSASPAREQCHRSLTRNREIGTTTADVNQEGVRRESAG